MNRIVAILILSLILAFNPTASMATETRIYISFSVGGAVMVGGGILWWSLTYATRVSGTKTNPPPGPPVLTSSDAPAQHLSLSTENEGFPLDPVSRGDESLFRLPLFFYRW